MLVCRLLISQTFERPTLSKFGLEIQKTCGRVQSLVLCICRLLRLDSIQTPTSVDLP